MPGTMVMVIHNVLSLGFLLLADDVGNYFLLAREVDSYQVLLLSMLLIHVREKVYESVIFYSSFFYFHKY